MRRWPGGEGQRPHMNYPQRRGTRPPLAHEPLAHAIEGLDVLLVDVLDRHKTHSGPRHRFRDALGIAAVVFVRLDIRLHELGCHELHLVAMLAEASRPVMRTATGFYADEYRGQLRQKGHQVMPGQALAQDDLASLIHSHRVKHALCNVDPEYAHLWFHWTRLLWLHGCTDLALIVAHRSRSAQGRVHFITTRHYPRLSSASSTLNFGVQ